MKETQKAHHRSAMTIFLLERAFSLKRILRYLLHEFLAVSHQVRDQRKKKRVIYIIVEMHKHIA